MNTENHIEEFIRKEKLAQPNPFLITRIMASVEPSQQKRASVWQTMAIAASFLIVVALGVGIGNYYNQNTQSVTALNINDSFNENLSMLNSLLYE